jgi:hypothetical protein
MAMVNSHDRSCRAAAIRCWKGQGTFAMTVIANWGEASDNAKEDSLTLVKQKWFSIAPESL